MRIGLVARMYDDAEFAGATAALVERLTAASPAALRTLKQNFLDASVQGSASSSITEAERHMDLFTLDDTREAFAAKVEKRRPRFIGA